MLIMALPLYICAARVKAIAANAGMNDERCEKSISFKVYKISSVITSGGSYLPM